MDSRIGLDYIVENSDYVAKLAAALDTNNEIVKKQVFELLSALCAYSRSGYSRAIETLENYKNLKDDRYRLKVVVTELDKTTAIEYKVTLLAFINCVIISAKSLQDRLRVRNEFIGLNLLPVLNNLRRIANSVPDLSVQLDVFDEQRECDESQSLQGPDGINLNSHLDVFYAILRQVADTPQEIPFLNILQHLLSIEPKDDINDVVWDTAETLVHRATLLENREDSVKLLRSPSVQKFSCPHCRHDITSPNRKLSLPHNLTSVTLTTPQSHSGAVPVVPISSSGTASAAPPPPPPAAPIPPPPPMISKVPNPPACPPAPNLLNSSNEVTRPKTPNETTSDSLKPLPQQETPTPRAKMKTINWNKIPPNKVVGKNNIWSIVAYNHQNSPMAEMNWDEMEGLFCQQVTQGSPKLGRESGSDTIDRRTRKDNEITLLDGKRSLNVNIFLKQFRSTNEEITQMIREGEHDEIGAEKLRGLLKILPEFDELEMLKNFDGEKNRLGNAEKFLLQLLKVPNYKLRIECMLLKEEFAANLSYLEPSINAMLYAGEDLMMNKALQEVLYMVVVAGNFLNAGGYAGNAAGVKLSSLQKLTDIRANKPGMNLIHFVALQAEKKNRDLLQFPEQFSSLENASKTTIEQLNNEINALDKRIVTIKKQIELPSTEDDIKLQMAEFLKAAESEVSMLQRGMKELETTRIQLAEFFCEDSGQFKIEECFKTFYQFCEKFKTAVKENDKRRVLEEQANIRRKQREEQLAYKKRQFSQAGTPVSDSENSFLMDPPTYDIRFSPAMSRRRMGSFNSNGDVIMREDGMSPDVTPNGSLRRRRSRVLSEEDEGNLMDFLRSSGHDGATRERKSAAGYGSLDRSWARRARSGSSDKKRPNLLNVDFGADRERPASPSPVIESKPLPEQEDPKPRISREWRQKIENWLQANEQDEKQNEEYRRKMRRVTSNRRSLETDTESEKGSKLDTLPEEKSHHSPSQNQSPSAIPTIQTTSVEPYRRVYPEWKPSSTLEKADVVGTIETLAGMTYVQTHARDKSAWRKSNLNVSNSSEEVDADARRLRRQRSREGSITSISGSPLHSILEEDKKKNPIPVEKIQSHSRNSSDSSSEVATSNATDSNLNKQSIYIRPPSVDETIQSPSNPKHNSSIYIRPFESDPLSSLEDQPNVPRRVRRTHLNETNNKIEIDSDNIETPPTVRKNFNHHPSSSSNSERTSSIASHKNIKAPRPLHKAEDVGDKKEQTKLEQEILGDGQFDRFSSARRTRRFKRPIDLSSATEDNVTNTATTSPDSISDASFPILKPEEKSTIVKSSSSTLNKKSEAKTSDAIQSKESKNKVNSDVVSRIGKIGKSISRISQEDVREAIRSLKSPTPEREWNAKDAFRTPPLSSNKIISHELNDEGFEETQSLVSDTPSLTTSSCNEEAKNQREKPSESVVSGIETTPKRRPLRSSNQLQSLIARNQQSLERSRSLRSGAPVTGVSRSATSTPRRTASLRRPETSQQSLSLPKSIPSRRLDVERSNSRTSLRSSRSSLNSAVSTNTVKKMPLKPTTSASSVSSLKKPLVLQNNSTSSTSNRSVSRVPASRSSSSGSSIGPTIRKPPTPSSTSRLSSTVSTSFKENQNSRSRVSPASSGTSTKTNGSGVGAKSSSPSGRSSSFMRPTAASATKVKSK
ncbi:CLUMA_CG010313, isoform A [Clunio marinus]|uniref:CLUMA_CG010313, isoform A n=1 Tax=Clunio marinus TaxID=568069 RepID=A0A1J1IDB3_9DIPT|nr:CLUMA_CG010313, isoform A [Clunio marinus]